MDEKGGNGMKEDGFPYQFTQAQLSFLIDSMDPFIDGLLLFFQDLRIGTLLETLEDLANGIVPIVSYGCNEWEEDMSPG